MFNKIAFTQQLKSLRCARNLTMQDLGQKLGVIKQTVGHWEKGIRLPDFPTIIAIADFFNISLDTLAIRGPYDQPDGQLELQFLDDQGNIQTSIFEYAFGIFPLKDIDFTPRFLVLDEIKGTMLEKIITTRNQCYFLTLICLLNERLNIGYRIEPDSSNRHSVNILVKSTDEFDKINPLPVYKELKSGLGTPVTLSDIFCGYLEFVRKYLKMSSTEKIEFLRNSVDWR